MKMMSLCVTLLAALAFSPSLLAQSSTGAVVGNVSDATGAVVTGAKVTLRNPATNTSWSSTTNDSGYYEFPLVAPGQYAIEAEHSGFKRFVRTRIDVLVNQRASIDIQLSLGDTTERIEVTSEAPLLDTESSSLGGVVTGRQIVDLPLNTRQVFNLAGLTTGVAFTDMSGEAAIDFNKGINFSVDGSQRQSAKVVLDGLDATIGVNNPSLQGLTAIPSVDAVQEFKIQSNNFTAEFGRAAGGLINVVLKSGTNQVHGSLYEFLRNSAMDANDFFSNSAGVPLGSFRRNQLGGSLGGPVYVPKVYNGRDKSFFFFSLEKQLRRSAYNQSYRGPTDLERAGDFRQTYTATGAAIRIFDPATTVRNADGSFTRQPFADNVVPRVRFSPIATKLLSYYPVPNNAGIGPARQNNLALSDTYQADVTRIDGKYDQVIGSGGRLSWKYSRYNNHFVTPNLFNNIAGGGNVQDMRTHLSGIELTQAIRPTLILNLAFGFSRLENPRDDSSNGFSATALGLPAAIDKVATHAVFPRIAPSGYATLGNTQDVPLRNFATMYQSRASLSTFRGKLSLKTGGEWVVRQVNHSQSGNTGTYNFDRGFTQGPNPLVPTATAGDGLASMLLGLPSGGALNIQPYISTQNHSFAGFVQSDYRATSRLTLNLGIRYEVELPRTERYDRQNSWDLTTVNPISQSIGTTVRGGLRFVNVDGSPRNPLDADWNNVSPRAGFAYRTRANIVVRGGYGIFFGFSPAAAAGVAGQNITGYSSTTSIVGTLDGATPIATMENPFPSGFVLPTGNRLGLQTQLGQDNASVQRQAKTAYMQQWNLNLQRVLPGNIAVEAAYAGSRGTHLQLPVNFSYNQLPDENLALGARLLDLVPNPFYGKIDVGTLASSTVQRRQLLRPFPQFTGVTMAHYPVGQSTYHSMQLRAERRFKAGLSVTGAYTVSKLLTNADAGETFNGPYGNYQNFNRFDLEKSLSSVDVPQRLVVSAVFQLPFGRARKWGAGWNRGVDAVLGGWQISGIGGYNSGFPISISATSTSQSIGAGTQRPNSTGHSAYLDSGRPTAEKLARWFDTSAFVQTPQYQFGNVGRFLPDVRMDGNANWDLAVGKTFAPFGERVTAQLRGEFFNATNSPRFAGPANSINSTVVGTVSGQANTPRQLQIGLRIGF
jgi:hypothetical protein